MKLLSALWILLLSNQIYSQQVFKLVEKCDSVKLDKYFTKGGDINDRLEFTDPQMGEYSFGLLSYATREECIECLQYLLLRKDQFQDFDLALTEAFVFSLSVGNEEISNLLYSYKPIPHGVCDACHGNNALLVAAYYGREDWYFKLKASSDLLYINTSGASLIHCAVNSSSQKILDDVLEIEGLDINKKDMLGFTPLDHAACNSDNPNAFQTLINKGADYKKAWNLLYWWCIYPGITLTDEMIDERRQDVWMIDEEGDNCLMLLSYFYPELDDGNGRYKQQLEIVTSIMLEDHRKGKSNLDFIPQFYSNGITLNFLDAMLFINDFESEQPVYAQYLNLLGVLCSDGEFCPVYKKEYKTAVKIYGEEQVSEWYDIYNLPTK